MRGLPLILVALFIDGLQALLSLAFFTMGSALTAVTPAGGAALGCSIGYAMSSGIMATPLNCIKGAFVGATASILGAPLGIALSFTTDICISATLGVGLMVLLAYNGMFYTKYAFGGGTAELIPGLDVFPAWTLMTILCIIRTAKEEGRLAGSALSVFTSMLSPSTALGGAVGAITAINQTRVNGMVKAGYATQEEAQTTHEKSRQRINSQLKTIDGIRVPQPKSPRRDVSVAANNNVLAAVT